jgi:hypothetical protein
MRVGWDKNTSRAAAQTLAISAFFKGGDFVTLPEYPASSNLPIMLSMSSAELFNTLPDTEFRLVVAVRAAPGASKSRENDWLGDVDRPGEDGSVLGGGGDVPYSDERNTPPVGEWVGSVDEPEVDGDPGTDKLFDDPVSESGLAEVALFNVPARREPSDAEFADDNEPCRSSFALETERPEVLILDGVPNPPPVSEVGESPDTLIEGAGGPSGRDDKVCDWDVEDIVAFAKLSARSEADSSLDLVRDIFFDGDWPMVRDDKSSNVDEDGAGWRIHTGRGKNQIPKGSGQVVKAMLGRASRYYQFICKTVKRL